MSSRALWLLLALAAAVHVGLWQVSEPDFLFNDYWKAYYPVAEYLWFDGTSEPWPSLEVGAGGFVNLPIVGWLFAPLAGLPEQASPWVYLAIGVIGTAAAWFLLQRHFAGPGGALPLAVLFLLNGPLINSLREGNSTHFVLLALVGGLILQQRGRGFLAGLLFGFSAVIKLPLLLFGAYFVLRRSWAVVFGFAAVIAGSALLSLLVHGLAVNIGWYRDSVAPFLGGVLAAFNVQSIDGFLLRLVTGTANLLDWTPHQPSLLHRLARIAIVLGLLGASLWLGARAQRGERRDLVEFCLVLVLALVISPICWTHYYLLMLLPAALVLGNRSLARDDLLFWLGYVLTALPAVILPLQPNLVGELLARTVISLWLFGGLMILAAHLRGLRRLA